MLLWADENYGSSVKLGSGVNTEYFYVAAVKMESYLLSVKYWTNM